MAIADGQDRRGRARERRGQGNPSTPPTAWSRPDSSIRTRITTRRSAGTARSRPSSWHGVTSVVMGNCGVGIAPLPARDARDRDARPGQCRGAFPSTCWSTASRWDWETFPEYMDAAAAPQAVAQPRLPGAADAVPPLRHGRGVDGAGGHAGGNRTDPRAARARRWTPVHSVSPARSSTSIWASQGRPLACRNASRDELKAYANVLKEKSKGAIEVALTRQIGVLEEDQCEMLDFLLDESGRPVTFIALFDRDDIPEAVRDTLRRAAPMIAQGRAAADLAAAAHPRDRHAQPVLVRSLPVLEARVRRQEQRGAEGGLPRPGLPQPVPRRAEESDGASATGSASRCTKSARRR